MNRNTALTAAGALVLTVAAGATALSFGQQGDSSPAPVITVAEQPSDPIVVVIPADGSAPVVTTDAADNDPQPAYQEEAEYAEAEYEEAEYEEEEYEGEEAGYKGEDHDEYESDEYEEEEYEEDEAEDA